MFPFATVLLTAVTALSSLVNAHPVEVDERQMSAAVVPVADPVLIDAIGVYPRVTRLEDGSLLAGYTTFEGSDVFLRTARSTNDGASWERLGVVDSGPSATREIDNAFPLAIGNGRILYAFRNHDKNNGGYTQYRITVCISEDGGASWRFLSQIDERAPSGRNGLWEPFLRIGRGGEIQAYYSAENADNDQDNIMRASTDGGATWGPIIGVSGGDVVSRDGMIGVSDAGNGNLIAVFENTQTGPFSVDYVLSSDDGYSWHSRGRVYTAVNNLEAGSPQVILVGGTIVASFMSNEAGSGPGVDNGEMKAVTSTDGGVTWSPATVIAGLGSHWPGMFPLSNTDWLAVYSFNGQGCVSRRFAL